MAGEEIRTEAPWAAFMVFTCGKGEVSPHKYEMKQNGAMELFIFGESNFRGNPRLYKESKQKDIHEAVISKHNTLLLQSEIE